MPAKRIVACLDIDGGRVVKGRRFNELSDAGDPATLAARYCREGVDEIVVLDVSATSESRAFAADTVAAVARVVDVPLTAGGGIRAIEDVERMLEAGADKVSINSAAFTNPDLLAQAASRFGSQCVVLAIDARRRYDGYVVATHGGRRELPVDALAWARIGERFGAGEVLVTSIDRDGTREGFDLELVGLLAANVGIPIVASGGAADAASFVAAFEAGADAALAASIFHRSLRSIDEIKRACDASGIEVRI